MRVEVLNKASYYIPSKNDKTKIDFSILVPLQLRIKEVNNSGFMNVSFYPKCVDLDLIGKLNMSNVQIRVIPAVYLIEN